MQTSGGDYDFEPACEPGRNSHRGDSPVLSAAGTQPPRPSRRKEIIKKKETELGKRITTLPEHPLPVGLHWKDL